MSIRKNVMSIAGLDPSGGAGLLADIKTFEMHQVIGFGVCSALTYQNDIELDEVEWVAAEKIITQIEVLFRRFEVNVFKIGIIENLEVLNEVCDFILQNNKNAKIIWDPIIKASAGFKFSDFNEGLNDVFGKIFLMTPNKNEFEELFKSESEALEISTQTKIYLKGGHNKEKIGVDVLIDEKQKIEFYPDKSEMKNMKPKHGSGCIFSAALCANLGLELELENACKNAKKYIEKALKSNDKLLAWHQ